MAEDRKPLADELGIPFYGQLMGMATGTEEDLYDAAYISRQYGLESEFKDEDRTMDSLRHILLGGLVYGDDSKENLLGQAGRGIAGFLADFREGDTPEDLIDLNNNEFGRKLREKYPDREEFIAKAKEIADALYVDGELPEIDGLTPQKSYGAFETPENLAKFEEENKKQVMEIGPDGTWQFTDEAKKEREAAGLNQGGIMAADGIDVSDYNLLPKESPFTELEPDTLMREYKKYDRNIPEAPEDFDPETILQELFPDDIDNIEEYEKIYPENESSESQYSSEEINAMDKELDQAFIDFENSKGSAADRDAYRKRVQDIYTSNPDLFRSQFQDKNTDQLIEMYNELDFSDEEVPFDDEIAETAKYRATVPFGSEDDTSLGGGKYFKHKAGVGNIYGKSRRYDDDVEEVFTPGGADKDVRDNILRHEGLHSLTDHESVRELLEVYPNELLVRAYDVLRGMASGDREWSEQALKFIEEAYKGKYGKKDIKLILSKLMPLLKEKAAEMNAGGLMTDPLVLSETAEEETEPKMGIGDYIQAGVELVEDFSPAGTAQSMIDAAQEAYKLATGAEDASFMDLGIAAIGAIPGGKTATKVVDNATKIADEIAEASLEISKIDNYVPKKTVTAYKLFTKGEDDNLYPLFVDANKPLPVGEWIKANMPDYIFQAKNGRYYVPSKATAPKTESGKKAFYDTGERKATGSSVEIPDDPELRKKLVEGGFIAKENTKSVKAVAARPGWHAGDVPIAHHIGAMIDPATGGTKKMEMPNVRRDDQVWAEVELPADVDWQQEALRRANVKKNGEIDVGTAHITDMVPHGGSYRYKTNPNMTGEWLIGGELKINRILDDAEVKAINDAAGVEDLPRYSDFMKQYTETPTQTGIMSAEGAAKKSPAVDMAINVRVDKKADLDYAEKLISGEKVYETRNSRSLDPYIGQRVGIAKTGDGKAQAIGSVEIGEPIEVDEKTFRELQDKHLVPEGSAFDVPKGGKKYLYPVSNPERFESPKDVGRGIVSRKIVNKYAGGLMLGDYNRAES